MKSAKEIVIEKYPYATNTPIEEKGYRIVDGVWIFAINTKYISDYCETIDLAWENAANKINNERDTETK